MKSNSKSFKNKNGRSKMRKVPFKLYFKTLYANRLAIFVLTIIGIILCATITIKDIIEISKISDETFAFLFWIGIMSLIGVIILFVNFLSKRNTLYLLKYGEIAFGKSINSNRKYRGIDQTNIYTHTFEFKAENGEIYQGIVKSDSIYAGEQYKLLYNPQEPSMIAIVEDLPWQVNDFLETSLKNKDDNNSLSQDRKRTSQKRKISFKQKMAVIFKIKKLYLIKYGEIAYVKNIERVARTFSEKFIYELEFKTKDEKIYKGKVKVPRSLSEEYEEKLLYCPKNPSKIILLNSLPNSVIAYLDKNNLKLQKEKEDASKYKRLTDKSKITNSKNNVKLGKGRKIPFWIKRNVLFDLKSSFGIVFLIGE